MSDKSTRENTNESTEELKLLLPWFVTGKLSQADMRRVEAALHKSPELRHDLDIARDEAAETVPLNEAMGTPSRRVFETVMAKVDAEAPERRKSQPLVDRLGRRLAAAFAGMRPRLLTVATAAAALLIVAQAGIVTRLLLKSDQVVYQTASGPSAPTDGATALVAFNDNATAGDIARLLQHFKGSIVEGPRAGGLYRVRFADASPADVERIVTELKGRPAVRFAAPE
jgi:hypothetical protein